MTSLIATAIFMDPSIHGGSMKGCSLTCYKASPTSKHYDLLIIIINNQQCVLFLF